MSTESKNGRSGTTALVVIAVLAGVLPAHAGRAQQPGRNAPAAPVERALRPRWLPARDLERALAPWRDPTRVVLKLVDDAQARAAGGRLERGPGGKDVGALQELLGGLCIETYIGLPDSELAVMRSEGEKALGQRLADLSQYFLVELEDGADTRRLVERLLLLPEVEEAYCLPRNVTVAGDITPPVTPLLTYAQPQNGRYNFPWVQSLPGGNGAGVTITDVEGSWNLKGMFGDTLTHEDLQGLDSQSPPPATWNTSTWVNPFADTNHGTAVLGMLGADADSVGVDGLVPGAALRVSAAHTTSGWRIADALVRATRAMWPRGMILIELQIAGPNAGSCPSNAQFGYLPVEYLSAEFNAIKQATALGMIVIEAAGNGQQDLDDVLSGTGCSAVGHSSYALFDPNLRNSDAILVGATDSFGQRAWFSNHGRRVDACALGENLGTLGYGDLFNGGSDVDQFYTQTFGGTSGASPQVTSAAAILQAAQDSYHGPLEYSPRAMQLLLRTAGTPTNNPALDRIGEQPELRDQYRIQSTGPRPAIVFDTRSALASNVGKWLDGVGDVDGDGYGDVAVSEPGYNSTSGRVHVLSGATGEVWWHLGTGGSNGARVSAAGDLNHDGFDDVIVSDPSNFQPGDIGGYALVFSGWDGLLLQWTGGGTLNDQWGCATDGLGDLDGVGWAEFVIGSPGWSSGRGRVIVYGSAYGTIDGELSWPGLGYDVANAGDVNGDGTNDLVASALQTAAGAGKVYVHSGADRSLIWSWSDSGSNGFGYSVAGAGDANADGYADILVGLPFYSSTRGRALVYSGKDGSVLRMLDGYGTGGRFGWNVDGLGDVNGNGSDDFLVSAYDELGSGQTGAVHVFDGFAGNRLRSYRGEARPGANGDEYGFAAASAGDIDGDGRNDVIVGAPGWGSVNVNDGRAYTYLSPRRVPSKPLGRGTAQGSAIVSAP